MVFTACLLALLLGRLIGPPLGLRSPYFPALMTGFEAGMMGYAIFGQYTARGRSSTSRWWTWGRSRSSSSSWSPYVLRLSTGAISFGQTLRNFLKTPVIITIFLGIVANRLGVLPTLQGWPVSAAVVRTVELLGGLTMPLIALVIGYEVRLQRGQSVEAGGGHRPAAPGVGAHRLVAERTRGSTVVRRRSGAPGRGDDYVRPAAAVRHPAVHA